MLPLVNEIAGLSNFIFRSSLITEGIVSAYALLDKREKAANLADEFLIMFFPRDESHSILNFDFSSLV